MKPAWEALNNISEVKDRKLIIVNDNGRSYAPTIGGLAEQFSSLRSDIKYEAFKDEVKNIKCYRENGQSYL